MLWFCIGFEPLEFMVAISFFFLSQSVGGPATPAIEWCALKAPTSLDHLKGHFLNLTTSIYACAQTQGARTQWAQV